MWEGYGLNFVEGRWDKVNIVALRTLLESILEEKNDRRGDLSFRILSSLKNKRT